MRKSLKSSRVKVLPSKNPKSASLPTWFSCRRPDQKSWMPTQIWARLWLWKKLVAPGSPWAMLIANISKTRLITTSIDILMKAANSTTRYPASGSRTPRDRWLRRQRTRRRARQPARILTTRTRAAMQSSLGRKDLLWARQRRSWGDSPQWLQARVSAQRIRWCRLAWPLRKNDTTVPNRFPRRRGWELNQGSHLNPMSWAMNSSSVSMRTLKMFLMKNRKNQMVLLVMKIYLRLHSNSMPRSLDWRLRKTFQSSNTQWSICISSSAGLSLHPS